jgi:two-component system NtrC family sensor kinase
LYEEKRVTGVLAICRDVTDERALMEQVVRGEKLAALGELVGGVAHEVNSPLTSILAYGQMLQTGTLEGEEAGKALDSIVNEARRAARIIGKFLTFARQHPSEKLNTDINQVITDTVELRRYSLRQQGIVAELDLDANLPVLWADPFQLQQVFINLINNAEQAVASREGGRLITIRSRKAGALVRITISDTGPGIASEHLSHIFNPFYTTKPRGVGTGLGLSISFGIVKEHGGTLSVQSELGHGATFEVLLPTLKAPLPETH